jgi:hypothetical protein
MKKGDILICIKERYDSDFKINHTYKIDIVNMEYCAVIDRPNHSIGFAYKQIDDDVHNNTHFIFEDYFISLKDHRKLKLKKINENR